VRELYGTETRTVEFTVRRFDPRTGRFRVSGYTIEVDRFTTVLDALIRLKEEQDPTLSVRYSCNMGICGSCAMVINGKPRLACETNLYSLNTKKIRVSPMQAHPLLRDLVTDFDDFFEKHKSVTPWLVRRSPEEKFAAEKEYVQTTRQVDYYLNFSYCIKCGLCVDACPVSNTNPRFVGPQALSQAYRYNCDSRDEGEQQRLLQLDTMDGVWGCEFSGSCSLVCPKGVDPALAIQSLKLDLMRFRLTGHGKKDKQAR
jgi:succinate dehydrogenase / fumarate reductase iron-sulfur subunit